MAGDRRPDRNSWIAHVDWLIPGIVSLGIMNNSLWSIGFMTVQARLRKLLKRLAASPMRRDFLMAPMIARLAFLGPEVAVPLLFGWLAFSMPIRGGTISIGDRDFRCADVRLARPPDGESRTNV